MKNDDQQQNAIGTMIYPEKGTLNRFLFKSPLIWWRMGLGPILSHKRMGGSRMLALTTRGRRSRNPHHTLLSFVSLKGKIYVCSGWGRKSDWYKNLIADPSVTVQIGNKTNYMEAYTVEDPDEFLGIAEEMFKTGGDSHFEPWLASFNIEFTKEDMVAKQDRLHLIGFNDGSLEGPPALPRDLLWVWGLIVLIVVGIIWMV